MKTQFKESKQNIKPKILFVLIMIVVLTGGLYGHSFSIGLGFDSFNYTQTYLNTTVSYMTELTDQVELVLGTSFGILVREQEPTFWLPLQIGLGFIFPDILSADGVLGVGLSPVFNWGAGLDDLNFYLGPYLQLGFRLQVHPFMRWFFDVQQDLHIGRPEWISTSTRVVTGINFFFDNQDE